MFTKQNTNAKTQNNQVLGKRKSKGNMILNPSLFRTENQLNASSRKNINKVENQKKVKQILYDLQVKNISDINFANLSEDLAAKHKKCEQLYDEIYEKKKMVEKNGNRNKQINEKDQNSDQYNWKRKIFEKNNMNESYNKVISKTDEGHRKLREEIKQFEDNGLNLLQSILKKKQKGNKQNEVLNEEQKIFKKMTQIDRILSNFMLQDIQQALSINGESSRRQKSFGEDKVDKEASNLGISRLQQILNGNKNVKNTTNIYTSQQLIEISRITLKKQGCLQN